MVFGDGFYFNFLFFFFSIYLFSFTPSPCDGNTYVPCVSNKDTVDRISCSVCVCVCVLQSHRDAHSIRSWRHLRLEEIRRHFLRTRQTQRSWTENTRGLLILYFAIKTLSHDWAPRGSYVPGKRQRYHMITRYELDIKQATAFSFEN